MASAGPAAGRGASTATAPAASGRRSGIPAIASTESLPGGAETSVGAGLGDVPQGWFVVVCRSWTASETTCFSIRHASSVRAVLFATHAVQKQRGPVLDEGSLSQCPHPSAGGGAR
jgi:hypothetical protein